MYLFHFMLGAIDTRKLGSDITVMLEEVQMTPSLLFEIVSRTGFAALRAWIEASSLAATCKCSSCGDFPVSRFWPTKFQGACKPNPSIKISVLSTLHLIDYWKLILCLLSLQRSPPNPLRIPKSLFSLFSQSEVRIILDYLSRYIQRLNLF